MTPSSGFDCVVVVVSVGSNDRLSVMVETNDSTFVDPISVTISKGSSASGLLAVAGFESTTTQLALFVFLLINPYNFIMLRY